MNTQHNPSAADSAQPAPKGYTKFAFSTDSMHGHVAAKSLQHAYDGLRASITKEMLKDGATLWVANEATGERITMTRDGAAS